MLSPGKIYKYEYLTGEKILTFNQSQLNRTYHNINLNILLWEKLLKNKQKQLKIKGKTSTIF